MFIVGLTGGIATGKSTVLAMFKEKGVPVIDADEIAKQVVEPGTAGYSDIVHYFGNIVLYSDGRINRSILSEIVFDSLEHRKRLNSITHPRIQSEMIKIAMKYFVTGHNYIVMELPLLFESRKMLMFMHKIITVVCDNEQQLERLCQRNEFTEQMALRRINAQMPLDLKVAASHFVIDNSGTIDNTKNQTEKIVKLLETSHFTWYFRIGVAISSLILMGGVVFVVDYVANSMH